MEGEKPVVTPGVKATQEDSEEVKILDLKAKQGKANSKLPGKPLTASAVTQYRAMVARGNYLAGDRPDLTFAIKECARHMADPTDESWRMMQRIGRYLLGRPMLVWWFKYQGTPRDIVGHSDSDWARCVGTRRSTTGGAIHHGGHLLKVWPRTQDTLSLSSADAELYAGAKCSAEVRDIVACYNDSGLDLGMQVLADASAALGIVRRHGLGKTRHIATSMLWVQQKHMREEIVDEKVKGLENVADLFTKYLSIDVIEKHVHALGCEFAFW